MAEITDRFQPEFVRWPIQNNRTGLQPVNLPIVLVVPWVRINDAPVANSGVFDLRYFIEDAPGLVPVAGFQNKGIFVPDLERFVVTVSDLELSRTAIPLEGQIFFDQETGEEKDFFDAVDGDFFEYTLERGMLDGPGARDRIVYHPDADYYDLSIFAIDTADLKPFGRYKFVWQASYNPRLVTADQELLCIDATREALARYDLIHAHPGEVHQALFSNTPSIYFDGQVALDDDPYVKFLRPFADLLQDIHDEQNLLEGVNFVNRIPQQLIPYLAYLVGWELPYFPGSTDEIRRNVLKNARRLQQLKGSRRVLVELFEIFGFMVAIRNLWYNEDGSGFQAPNEDQITEEETCRTEPLVSDFSEDGFGQIVVPLLFRPTSDVTVDAYLVDIGSAAEAELQAISDSVDDMPESVEGVCALDLDGYLLSPALASISPPILGFSKVLIDLESGQGTDDRQVNDAPLNKVGLRYGSDNNVITVTFDHYIDFDRSRQKLFIFATYLYDKLVVPPELQNLQSNRFDIQILSVQGEEPTSQLYEFLLDFVLRLKAFHSLLRKIIILIDCCEVYNVQDFCLGGLNKQAPGTDAGELQTPPAIIPLDPTECDDDRGFSQETLDLRAKIIAGLENEHQTWKDLDGTHVVPEEQRAELEALSNVAIPRPDASPCEFTPAGQDRVISNGEKDFDHIADDRSKLCSTQGNSDDYCYKGRVQTPVEIDRCLIATELLRCKPCNLGMGHGAYYTTPIVPEQVGTFADDRCDRSSIGVSFLHTLFARVKSYQGATLHYTDRDQFRNDLVDSNEFFAIRRPSLDIQKDNLFFPGHRFVSMNKLENDFVSIYSYRPWDDIFHKCPEAIGTDKPTIEDLNPLIVEGTDGDEFLTFEDIPLEYCGNGLVPDISSLSVHAHRDFLVTHAIYSTAEPRAVSTDPVVFEQTVFTDVDAICLGSGVPPIFESANENCACPPDAIDESGSEPAGVDFANGYPAETGRYEADLADFDYPRGTSEDVDVTLLLGVPQGGGEGTEGVDLLFKCGSGILVAKDDPRAHLYAPYRLDCGCETFGCDPTNPSEEEATIDRCSVELFRLPDSSLDFNCDRVTTDLFMVLTEKFGTCSTKVDGTIPNMLCFDETAIDLEFEEKYPEQGQFKLVDDYGIIYIGMFETSGSRIDITVTTLDPRVWGEPPSGRVEGRRVFRRGIVTTCRQIIEHTDDGYIILAEGCEQRIDEFQTNFVCGDEFPQDPFAFHVDCGVCDEVEMELVEVTG